MNIAVVLAAGKGTRFGNDIPKQYVLIDEKPLYIYTLEKFEYCDAIDRIVLVLDEENINNLEYKNFDIHKVFQVVSGGATRQESVLNALKNIKIWAKNEDIILIHDGARPLVSEKIIRDNIESCKVNNAVCTVTPCVDTVVEALDKNKITSIPNRNVLFNCQTPQTFKFSIIYWAHENAVQTGIRNATDDCQLLAKINKPVFLVSGETKNIKITTREDLVMFKQLIKDL